MPLEVPGAIALAASAADDPAVAPHSRIHRAPPLATRVAVFARLAGEGAPHRLARVS